MVAFRTLRDDKEFRAEVHPHLVDVGDEEAVQVTLRAIRRTFGVTAYADDLAGGLTELETLELLGDFYEFIDSVKKNTRPSQTPSASTEPILSPLNEMSPSDTAPCSCSSQEKSFEQPTE